jgi:hypothetical protein
MDLPSSLPPFLPSLPFTYLPTFNSICSCLRFGVCWFVMRAIRLAHQQGIRVKARLAFAAWHGVCPAAALTLWARLPTRVQAEVVKLVSHLFCHLFFNYFIFFKFSGSFDSV